MQRATLVGAVALALISSPSLADLAGCLSIEADLDRLSCYDKEAGRTPTVSVAPATPTSGKWTVKLETSAMTDRTEVFMHVLSNESIQCRSYGSSERPALMLRCMENKTAAMLITSSCHLTSSRYNDYGDIQYRVDDKPAKTKSFEASTSNDTLGLWEGGKAIPFIKELFGGDKVVMKFTPYGESPRLVTFDISGLDEAIKPLREQCGW